MTVSVSRLERMCRQVRKAVFWVGLLLLASSGLFAQNMASASLKVDGIDRLYLWHLPTGYRRGKPFPLVLVFHAAGMTAAQMAALTQLNQWADKMGFVVAYPEGLEQKWNTGQVVAASTDDFTFVAALIANIRSKYTINPNLVSAAGMSNGAEFAQELGCRKELRFRSIVAVSGALQKDAATNCLPAGPTRVVTFHGTEDPIVPYLGGRVAVPGGPNVLSVADDLQVWTRLNKCSPDLQTERLPRNGKDGPDVERVIFRGCEAGGEVTHYRILGGGHTWPGASNQPKMLGRITQQIDASQYIAQLVSVDKGN